MNINNAQVASLAGPSVLPNRSTATAPTYRVSTSPRRTEALLPRKLSPVTTQQEPLKQEVAGSARDAQARQVEDIRQSAAKANAYLNKSDTYLQFNVSELTGRVIVKIIDENTKEVVREIPPETMARFAERIKEMKGLLLEAKG
jgi:flagellar protein FlaG